MHLIYRGHGNREGESVRIAGPGKKLFRFFRILCIGICKRFVVIGCKSGNHCGPDLCSVAIVHSINDVLRINGIAECLPDLKLIEGLCRIVQIQCLHGIGIADVQIGSCRIHLLGDGSIRRESVDCSGLEIHKLLRGICKEAYGNLIQMCRRPPVILKALQCQMILNGIIFKGKGTGSYRI